MAEKETTFINKCSIKEHKFDNGDSVLNMAVHVDELIMHKNGEGWINLTICKRREKSDKGHTHYAKINEYEPDVSKATDNKGSSETGEDDLPF
tara:strand:+ start:281 stop:559 length:279 start_codon:yes stop_codon:yes gene_type:complete